VSRIDSHWCGCKRVKEPCAQQCCLCSVAGLPSRARPPCPASPPAALVPAALTPQLASYPKPCGPAPAALPGLRRVAASLAPQPARPWRASQRPSTGVGKIRRSGASRRSCSGLIRHSCARQNLDENEIFDRRSVEAREPMARLKFSQPENTGCCARYVRRKAAKDHPAEELGTMLCCCGVRRSWSAPTSQHAGGKRGERPEGWPVVPTHPTQPPAPPVGPALIPAPHHPRAADRRRARILQPPPPPPPGAAGGGGR
jgi:hypothetical protein